MRKQADLKLLCVSITLCDRSQQTQGTKKKKKSYNRQAKVQNCLNIPEKRRQEERKCSS